MLFAPLGGADHVAPHRGEAAAVLPPPQR